MNKPIGILFLFLCFSSLLPAESKDTNPGNLKIAQESVKFAAGDIQVKLDTIIQEMKKNGLADMDEAALHQTLAALGSLTESEMQTVISSLKKADSVSDTQEQSKNLTDAYMEQGKISQELTHMASSFQQAQALSGLSEQVRNLLRRQLEAERDSQAQLIKPSNEGFLILDDQQKTISQDISRLPSLMKAGEDTPDEAKAILKDSLDYLSSSGLDTEGKKAAQQVTAKKMDQAQPSQQKVVEILGVLLEKVSKIDELMKRLQKAKDGLEVMIRDESDMAQRSEQGNSNKADVERQAEIGDDVSITRQELKQINPVAIAKLDDAGKNIQKSQDELKKQKDGKTASQPQKDATESLRQAKKEIEKQLEQLVALEQKSEADKIKDLKDLANQAQKAADEERQLAQKPDQPKQQDLAKQTEKLQQDTLPLDQKASDMLTKASDQMEQKQPDATQAADTLQQAANELNHQADAMQQEMAQQDQAQQNDKQLSQMEQDLQKIDQSLQQNKDQQQSAQQIQAMAQQMGQMEQQQQDPTLKQEMQQAQNSLNEAAKEAPQNAQQAAQTNQQTIQQMQQMQAAMAAAAGKGPSANGQGHGKSLAKHGASGGSGKIESSGADMSATAMVVGILKPKDRDAMSTYENDKIPQGYESMVKQYRQNLAEPAE